MSQAEALRETSTPPALPAAVELDIAAVVDSMAVGVFVADASGYLVAANAAGLRIVRARDLDQLRSSSHPFPPPREQLEDGTPIPSSCLPMQRALAGERSVHQVEILDYGGGDRTVVRVTASPIFSTAGAIIGAVKVVVDVTAEHELARAKDEFIRTAAHELKTPLAVIKANADVALRSLPGEPEAAQRPLEGMSRGIDRIDRLVGSLLDLVDVEGGLFGFSRIPVRLDELVARVISRLPERAAARVHMTGAPSAVIKCDESRLRRALLSIVDNALKYSSRGSPVEISARVSEDKAIVEVRDHGIGIPADKRTRIFEKYFRAHAGTALDSGGIGVGLFVAREIITQHGGLVWFESIENNGTSFFVQLPLDRSAT